jgi:hypothetical protein
MLLIREWLNRVLGAFRGGRSDQDLEAELRSHLEMAGDGARHAGVAQAMDALRDQRSVPWLDDLFQDVRYACRGMAATGASRPPRSSPWRLALR